LKCFADFGILRKIIFENKVVKYELIQEEKKEQDHIICRKCGKKVDIKHNDFIQIVNKTGFKIIYIQIKLFGLCSECKMNH